MNSMYPGCLRSFFVKRSSAFLVTLLCLAFALPVEAADPTFGFAAGMVGSTFDGGQDIVLDASGNVYTTGTSALGTVDFDPGPGTLILGGTSYAAYVQKLDSSGNLLWAKTLYAAAGSSEGFGITLDPSSNVLITGTFRDTVDFDPGAGTHNITSGTSGRGNIFVLKLDSSGNFIWARAMIDANSSNNHDYGYAIKTDASGNVYTTGTFDDLVDFDPGAGTANLTASASTEIFIHKMDSSGNFVWVKSFTGGSGSSANKGFGIDVDASGNVYTTGSYSGSSTDFDPGAGVVTLGGTGAFQMFISKLDTNGDYVWAKAFLTAIGEAFAIAVDASENVYTTGYFVTDTDFDPGPGTFNINGNTDIYVSKLDSNGDFVWAKAMGGANFSKGYGIKVDSSGNVYTTGFFEGTVDFDPGAGTHNVAGQGFGANIFIQKLDSAGELDWVTTFGSTTALSKGWGIDLDATGNIYTTGLYGDTVDFDPGAGTNNVAGMGIYVNKLLPTPVPTVSSIVRTDANPTSASSVDFTVTFSESVTGVDTSDFTPDETGVSGAVVTGVAGTGATRTVSVSTGSGTGTLSVDVTDDDTIINGSSIPLGDAGASNGDFTAGEDYTINGSGPTVAIGAPSLTDTNSGPVSFGVTYTGAATVNLTMGDVSLNSPGTATASTITVTNGTTSTPTVTLSGISGDGTLGITLAGGVADDGMSNFDAGAGPSTTFNVDNNAPALVIESPSETDTSSGPISFVVTYTGSTAVNLTSGDISLNGAATASTITVTDGTTTTPTVTLSDISGNGTLGITVGSDTSSDLVGNTDIGAGPSSTFNVSNATPSNVDFGFAVSMGGTASPQAKGIVLDPSGNIHTTGTFNGTGDFDPGAGTLNLTTSGARGGYIQKLDSNGDLIWAKGIVGTGWVEVEDIALDDSGNVYITGGIQGTCDFNPGAGTHDLTSPNPTNLMIFALKLDSNGDFVWAHGLSESDTFADSGKGIETDSSGNVYVTGMFDGTVDFDPGVGLANLTSSGREDIFIQKLDSSGNLIWAKSLPGSAQTDEVNAMTIDPSGNIYFTGYFSDLGLDFDPGPGTVNLTTPGALRFYVAKYNSDGDYIWAKGFSSTIGTGYGIEVDTAGNVLTTGPFTGTTDFDPGAGTHNLVGNQSSFVSKLDSNGDFVWAKMMDGTGSANGYDVATDTAGNVYTTGFFQNTIDFNPGVGVDNRTSVGSTTDIFIQKLDSAGTFVWVNIIGADSGTGDDDARAIAIDAARSVFTTGKFTGTVDFNPGTGIFNLTGGGVFISKLVASDASPFVVSVARADTNPTNASSVDFTVTFSESVTGVGTGDFNIDASGVTGASVTGISGSGTTRTVTVDTGTGSGTLSIDVDDDDTIIDGGSTPLDGTGLNNGDFTAGENYTLDRDAPTVAIGAPSVTDTNSGPVSFPITYTGADTINLTMGDISLNGTPTVATITITNGTTSTPTVTLSGISGNSTLGISINAGTSSDNVGNSDIGAGPSATFNVDDTAPTVGIGAPSITDTNSGPVAFAITYSGATTVNLTMGDISLDGTATASTIAVTNGATSTPTVTLSGISGNGTLGISIAAGTSQDGIGNLDAGAGPSMTFNVDNIPGTVAIGAPSLTDTASGPVSFEVTYVGAVSNNLTSGDISLNSPGTATASTITITNGTISTPTVTLSGISGNGTLGISIGGGTSLDGVGNLDIGAGPSTTFNVMNTAPSDMAFGFAAGMGGQFGDEGRGIAVDASGNVYSAGTFNGTGDFDPGPGTLYLTTSGVTGGYIQKLDSNGDLLWAKGIVGPGFLQTEDIALDASGNVYITGAIQGTCDFDPGPGTHDISSTAANSTIVFIMKLDANGDFVWAHGLTDPTGTLPDTGKAIEIGTDGNLYLTGMYGGTVDFDPGAGTFNMTHANTLALFIQKLDANGNFIWAKGLTGSIQSEEVNALAVDASGDFYMTGMFSDLGLDFDPGPGTATLSTPGALKIYIVKYDTDGNYVWVKGFSSTIGFGCGIDVDTAGNVLTTGAFTGTTDFDPGAGTFNLVGDQSTFVSKLDSNGDFVWAKAIDGTGNVTGRAIATDLAGNVYTTGIFQNTIDFNPDVGVDERTSMAATSDLFIQKLDATGAFAWVHTIGAATGTEDSWAIAVDPARSVYTTGKYTGTVDFDIGSGTFNLTGGGAFVSKLVTVVSGPFVISVERADANPTNASSVDFTVTFNETVTGVNAGDFAIDASGVVGASVAGVTGSGATRTVTLNTGTGDGTLSIDVIDDDTIVDGSSNPLDGAGMNNGDYTAGETYTFDNIAPSVSVSNLTTSDTTPSLVGIIDDPLAAISVSVDGQINPATNNGASWLLTNNTLLALGIGTYDVVVTATDAFGNIGTDATINEVTIRTPGSGGGTVTPNLPPEATAEGERLEMHAPEGGSDYQWKKDGVDLVDDGRISGSQTRILVIDPLLPSDAGVYSCRYDDGSRAIVETDGLAVSVAPPGSTPPPPPAMPLFKMIYAVLAMLIVGLIGASRIRRRIKKA